MNRLLSLSRTLLAAAALTVIATSAHAVPGINLSWNECSTFGALQRNFACTSNTGANTMYGSAVVPVAMGQLNGHAAVIDLQTNEALLSNWWQIGTCRLGSTVSSDYNFLTSTNCFDPWGGVASGGVNYAISGAGPNRARIRTVCAISPSGSINNTDEYYFFKVTFTNAKSFGNGACAGCVDGACFVFNSLEVTQPIGVGDYIITNALLRRHILWQAGGAVIGGLGCPLQVPARSQTWGSVKSLYR